MVNKSRSYYSHSPYQCAVVAVAASTSNLVRIVEMQTGSGKTWVQGLLAVFYANLGMKVTIIEPT